MSAFDIAIAFTLPAEGGYVNNVHDSGGATDRGITQTTYDLWRGEQKQPKRDVALLTQAEAINIYEWMYWQPAHCPQLPLALAIAHFDWSVNHGISGAGSTLQLCLGVKVDGDVGPKTLAAVATVVDPVDFAVNVYNHERRRWYNNRVKERPDQGVFLGGWLKRVNALDNYVIANGKPA